MTEIDASTFIAEWQARPGYALTRFPREALAPYQLPAGAVDFLAEAGLPSSAAPFLVFRMPKSGRLETMADTWQLDESFSRWINIGHNGSGDPIVIDATSPHAAVYYLNHDHGFTPRLIAS